MFGITTELPTIYIIFCLFLGLGYSYILYRKSFLSSKSLRVILFFLRSFIVSFLFFLLLNPVTSISKKIEEKPIVVLAQDVSISCSDVNDFNKFKDLEKSLSKDFDVFSYNYSDEVRSGFSLIKEGKSTNISKLIDEVDLKFSGRNLLGVVLTSDGLFNEGINPIYHKAAKSIPFYTILVGDTAVIKDVRISDVLHNEISFLDNISPIQIQIQTDKCKGEDINLKLYRENNLIENKKIRVNTNSDFIKLDFNLDHNQVGLQKYRVVLSSVDGEKFLDNNSFTFFIDVLDSRYKILILSDIVHPDISAIRSVLENNKHYEVDFFHIEDFQSKLEEYNLAITFYINDKELNILNKLNESSVPLLMFVNSKSISLLNTLYSRGAVSRGNQTQEVSAFYNTNFTKFNISPDLQTYLSDLPPLISIFGTYNMSATSEVLLYQKIGIYETDNPLIILDETSERKISIVYAEGIWRWRINDRQSNLFHQNFDELFSKISQYLLIQEEKNRFRVLFDQKVEEGEDIIFKCEYYNDNYELDNNKEVEHIITDESGKKFKFVYSKNNFSYYLNLGTLSAGKYVFTSYYNEGQEKISGEFTIIPKQIETKINTANYQLLHQFSKESNALTYSSFNVEEISDYLISSPLNKTIFHESNQVSSVINKIWILVLLLFLLFSEWVIRKYNGFY